MPLIIKDQKYLDEVIAFAKAEGIYEQPTVRIFGMQAVRRVLAGYLGGEKINFLPRSAEIGGGFVDAQPMAIEIDVRVARFMLRLASDQTKEMVEQSIYADVPDPKHDKRDAMFLRDALNRFEVSKQDVLLSKGGFDLPKWSFNVVWARPNGGEATMFGGLCFFGRERSSSEDSVGWSVHT